MQIIDEVPVSMDQIYETCSEICNLRMIVVDYLQLMSGESSLHKTQSLRKLAEVLDVPVICASQMTCLASESSGYRPVPDDLFLKEERTPGPFSEEALDQILFVYQPTEFRLKGTMIDLYQK